MTKMIYKKAYTIIIFLVLCANMLTASGQQNSPAKKETAEEYVTRIRVMADSIKLARTTNQTATTTKGSGAAFSNGNYATNKATIDNAYNFLSPAEKEKVKKYPAVPEAFRNSEDAADFLNKLKGLDINADVQQHAKEKSMALFGFCISFQSTKTKAEKIIKEANSLTTAFKKANPVMNFGTNVGKTYVSENGLVYLPLGDASFADEAMEAVYKTGNIQFPKENAVGQPNYVLMKDLKQNKGVYSLGNNGTLTLKFINNALVDVAGPDLFVFEAGEIEPTNLEISKDGVLWVNVGKIGGGIASVDISKVATPMDCFYYVRFTDLNTKSTVAGADIDAVAAIGAAIKLSLTAEVLFDLGKATLKPDGISAVNNLAQQLKQMNAAQISVDGYTDDIGNNDENLKLSKLRAEAVSAVLKEVLKSKDKFVYRETGRGESNPAVSNTTDANRKKNRRVEILVFPK